jgi:hypothetical protein
MDDSAGKAPRPSRQNDDIVIKDDSNPIKT